MFRILTLIGVLVLGVTKGSLPAIAQEFPKKQPIKIVVAHPPGGLADSATRIMAEFLQRRLGQPVIVENRPGASGTIGADYVSKAPADGHTLFMAETSFTQVPAVRDDLTYKVEDFTYLVQSFNFPALIMVGPKVPVSTMPELVAYMKANPNRVRYGTTGVGATMHLLNVRFERAAGVKGVHVPYVGIGPAYVDLLAGHIDYLPGGVVPFPDGAKVVGSAGSRRHPAFPNLPTLEEVGIKNASMDFWHGYLAPPNLPKPIAERLIAEISAVLTDPEAIAKYQSVAKIAPEQNPLTGDAFKKNIVETAEIWRKLATEEKIVIPR